MISLDEFRNQTILVIGDVMLDRFWWGDVTRISPEAPVPIVRLLSETLAPGGAANVAANIVGLGAEAILVGCVGNDPEARTIEAVLAKSGVRSARLMECSDRRTTVKTRILAHGQQVTRVDQETTEPLDDADESRLLNVIREYTQNAGVIALSDYAKGVLSEKVVQEIVRIGMASNIPVVVDPKGGDYAKYHGATVLTPNRKEAIEACKLDEQQEGVVESAGGQILSVTAGDAVIITLGEEGMTLFAKSGETLQIPASAREVYDVTGAGDTVIATLSVAIAAGYDLKKAAQLANAAAGIVVEQIGTTPVRIEQLQQLRA